MTSPLLLVILLGAAQHTGQMSPTSDVSSNRVKATGASTSRALRDHVRTLPDVDWGAVGIGSAAITATGGPAARALRYWFADEVIYPSGDTTGATDAAAINLALAFERPVRLVPASIDDPYYVNTSIRLATGSRIRGSGTHYDKGTAIKAVGDIPIMKYVPTTRVAQPTLSQVLSDAAYGIDVQDLYFFGGTYAIQIGGLYNSGAFESTFRNLRADRWTKWAFWFENCSLSRFDQILAERSFTVGPDVGQMMFAASQSAYNHGNSTITHLFASAGADKQRGIVFKSYGGIVGGLVYMNDVNVLGIQFNGGSNDVSADASSVGTTTSLTLSAYGGGGTIADFPIDMPVTVGTTAIGLTKWQSYYVVANNGVDTISLSDKMGGTAKTIAEGTATIYATGFPLIEVVGMGGSSGLENYLTGIALHGIDAEGATGNQILAQNTSAMMGMSFVGSSQSLAGMFSSLTLRGATVTWSSAANSVTTDIDSGSWRSVALGYINPNHQTTSVGLTPQGYWYDTTNSVMRAQADRLSAGTSLTAPTGTISGTFAVGSQLYAQSDLRLTGYLISTGSNALRATNYAPDAADAIGTQFDTGYAFTTIGSRLGVFLNNGSAKFSIEKDGATVFGSVAFADLQAPHGNGTVVYCTDCTLASPCASGGSGALAKRIAGAWVCN